MPEYEICPQCLGEGSAHPDDFWYCPHCDGGIIHNFNEEELEEW